jgi:hypothetical protein
MRQAFALVIVCLLGITVGSGGRPRKHSPRAGDPGARGAPHRAQRSPGTRSRVSPDFVRSRQQTDHGRANHAASAWTLNRARWRAVATRLHPHGYREHRLVSRPNRSRHTSRDLCRHPHAMIATGSARRARQRLPACAWRPPKQSSSPRGGLLLSPWGSRHSHLHQADYELDETWSEARRGDRFCFRLRKRV